MPSTPPVFITPAWSPRTAHERRITQCVQRRRAPKCIVARASSAKLAERQWAEAGGATINSAVDVDDSGALVTVKNVLKGTELAEIPLELVLTTDVARDLLAKKSGNDENVAALSDESALAAALLLKQDTTFGALVEALRTEFNHAFLWSDAELEALSASTLRGRAKEVRNAIESEWDTLHNGPLGAQGTLDDYLWAQAAVQSCAVRLSSRIVLAPLLTAAGLPEGEDSKANTRLQSRGGSFFAGRSRIVLIAERDLVVGDRISIDRDAVTDMDELLLDFGLSGGEPRFELDLSITPLDRFYEDKEDVLKDEELLVTESFDLRKSDNTAWTPPDNLEPFVRLMCLGGTDAFLLESVFRKEIWGFMNLPVSKTNEKALCDYLIGACEDALDAYEDDVGDAQTTRSTLARTLVDAEKEILCACRDHYRRYTNSLDDIQYYQERRLNELDLLRPLDESEIVDAEGGARMGRAFDENY